MNWRGTALLLILSRVLATVVLNRMKRQWIKYYENRLGSILVDHVMNIYILQQIKKATAWQKRILINFDF